MNCTFKKKQVRGNRRWALGKEAKSLSEDEKTEDIEPEEYAFFFPLLSPALTGQSSIFRLDLFSYQPESLLLEMFRKITDKISRTWV